MQKGLPTKEYNGGSWMSRALNAAMMLMFLCGTSLHYLAL